MAATSEQPLPAPLSAEALFDAVGPAYEVAFEEQTDQDASVDWLISELAAKSIRPAKTVDIGCGTGRPVCSKLADAGHDVLGIDLSGAMITSAKERVPNASFEKLDIRDFNPPADSYDVATAYFSLIAGVTQDEIRGFMAKIFGFVKPGGLLVWGTVPLPVESEQIAWMGKPITVSSLAPEGAVDAVKKAGWEVVKEVQGVFKPKGAEAGICKQEDVWEETHLYIYARKPE
ncbi:S-adenosyl-L-methionine-dependent methyltransferase [Apodospora peruviana]|uniref:S-adenosyl-L-methionine-dependent methyltransferase n=1 Tax=Apodospora peruviana TaxID=516989 RepID=A0AAE0HV32_9PEZI|nr:S-adenosyl-L-methionine-dependent methyltransferase [Apodospora peruviana]